MQDSLSAVRAQYERYPYPKRNPEDERSRLLATWNEHLAQINHYCYAGKQTFRDGFRVLVAGGGTGDNSIFLAEQLRDTDAAVVHIDLSAASLAVARERARIRGLSNMRFVRESLLDLPKLGLGPFDFISCCGVLHHLQQPERGLDALLTQLKPEGAMNLMVYGRIARTAVFQVQELARLVTHALTEPQHQVRRTRDLVASLPPGNWWKRSEDLLPQALADDVELTDTFLHPQERAYSVAELYAWIEDRAGLHLQFSGAGIGQAAYLPEFHLRDPAPDLAAAVAALPARERHVVAELAGGSMVTHTFYATRRSADIVVAQPADLDQVPFFFRELSAGPELALHFDQPAGERVRIEHPRTGTHIDVAAGRYGKYLMRHLDGRRSLREIFDSVRNEPELRAENGANAPADAALAAEFAPIFTAFNRVERMLLRHVSTPALPGVDALQARARMSFQ